MTNRAIYFCSSSDGESTDESVNEETYFNSSSDELLSALTNEQLEEKLDTINSIMDEVLVDVDKYFEDNNVASSTYLV